MAEIRIENVDKRFGTVMAVHDLSLTIGQGEMVSLLGPSGCGKTTTLRMLAGLESISSGTMRIDGQVINDLPPQERNVGIVFQDYAIFQTMSVERNVAYGLEVRRVPADERRRRVAEALELVGLEALGKRMPGQLSGGQLQRVALARALVIRPRVLLLDEPLSNLDASLRQNLRKQIRTIQKELGITAIFVTHDQEEAMSISDRIAVMNTAKMIQHGTPQEIYEGPRTAFVAAFIGKTNLLSGRTVAVDGGVRLDLGGLQLMARRRDDVTPGEVWVSIRPQDLRVVVDSAAGVGNAIAGRVSYLEYLGSLVRGEVVSDVGQPLLFEITNPKHAVVPAVGDRATLTIAPEAITYGNVVPDDLPVLEAARQTVPVG
jgi:ABC-type Fe3+/spermidine/putrescine transport system ATPase subunit